MVIGDISPSELALPLRRARESLGREINPTVFTAAEFKKKRAAKDHFITQILSGPKLFVLGENDELVQAAE